VGAIGRNGPAASYWSDFLRTLCPLVLERFSCVGSVRGRKCGICDSDSIVGTWSRAQWPTEHSFSHNPATRNLVNVVPRAGSGRSPIEELSLVIIFWRLCAPINFTRIYVRDIPGPGNTGCSNFVRPIELEKTHFALHLLRTEFNH
jgi:hypothetical protein